MKVQSIHHVSVLVRDLDKARSLYSAALGLEFEGPFEQRALDVKYVSSPLGINLAAPLTEDGPTARSLQHRGEGLSMLVLNVEDIDAAIKDLEARGIRLVGREDRSTERVASFHPRDMCGVMIELTQKK